MGERSGRTVRGALHVLLGGVFAAALALLTYSFVTSFVNSTRSSASVAGLSALVVVTAALAALAITAPPVRPLEIAAGRTLLDLDVPDAARPSDWTSRRRGAAWLILNVAVGGAALFALLFFVPLAVGAILFPFGGDPVLRVPGLPDADVGTGLHTVWLWPVALALLALGAAALLAGTAVLRAAGPRLLGPTAADELELLRHREQQLARQNQLARDLHDTIGHALTAMTIQADAGARVVGADPDFARRAFDAIGEVGRTALDELDAVLGALRDRDRPPAPGRSIADIGSMISSLPHSAAIRYHREGSVSSVAENISAETFKIVQESVTNALRHGNGDIEVKVTVGDMVTIETLNSTIDPVRPQRPGRGLIGMSERVLLLGGSLDAGPEGGTWRVRATLPVAAP